MSDLPSSSLRFFAARRFFPLFLTQLLGAFNDNVLKCAFTLLATFHFSRTHGWNPAISTQLIAALFVLPFFLFSAHAGQLADKFDKARLVVLAKIWELLAMALGSAALLAASPWLLAVTLFLLGAQAAFFGPLKYALLPQHLRENELLAGNALVEAATYIAILAGTVAGGRLVLDASGNPSPLPVCVILLTCSLAGLLSALRIPPAPSENPSLKLNPNLLSATAALLKNASRNGPVFRSILGISWFWLIGAFWLTLTPAFVSNHLRGDAGDVTALLLLFALGIGAGSLLCNKLLRGEVSAKFVPLAGIAGSLFMADAAVLAATLGDRFANGGFSLASPAGLRLSVDLAGIAVAGGVFSVPLYALMQRHSAPTHRSRMVAANNILNALFMAAAAALAAALFALNVPVAAVILLFALLNLAVALYSVALVPEAVLHTFLRWLLRLLYRVEVRGLENYRAASKRRVIIANHTSYLDAVLLTAFLPERPTFAVASDYASKWWMRQLSRLVNFLPVDPSNALAIKKLTLLARAGVPVAIFPEGRLTTTGGIMKIYEGPGLIADKANADLLPVQIDGAMRSVFSHLRGKVRSRLFPKITLTILPPRKFHPPENLHGRDGRQYMAQQLYDILAQIHLATSDTSRPLFLSLIDAAILNGHSARVLDDTNFKPLTYRKLIAASLFLGPRLAAGTRPGDPVGLLIANSAPAVIAFFALQSMGRVTAMLNYSSGPAPLAAACRTASLKHAWTSRKFVTLAHLEPLVAAMRDNGVAVHYLEDAARRTWKDYLKFPLYLRNARWIATRRHRQALRQLQQQQPAPAPNLECGNLSPLSPAATCRPAPPETSNLKSQISPPASTSPLHAAIAQTRARLIASIQKLTPQQAAANPSPGQPAADPADRPAVILFTSGSSGLPKGVVLSHRNLQTNRHQLVAVLDVTSRDRFFSSLPVFHAFGLTGGVIAPLLHGTPVFMYPTPLHYGIIPELVYQTNSTVLFGTNTFLAGYAKRAHPYDLYSVRFAVAGAEKLKDETRRLFSQKFGVRVFDAYGVTEASPGVCINTPMHNRPGTVGQFLPGIEWRLDPVPGIPRGGRLWIRSANIMLGYLLHDQPGQLQPLPDGWYDTGDIVDVDADGYVTILGRAKRFAKIAGEMVSLTLVEDLAASLWPDNQHAAITRPHPQKGEEILLVTDAPDASRAALQEAAKSRGFPELALPRQILIEPAIPLLGSGKPDYPALEKLHNPSATS